MKKEKSINIDFTQNKSHINKNWNVTRKQNLK